MENGKKQNAVQYQALKRAYTEMLNAQLVKLGMANKDWALTGDKEIAVIVMCNDIVHNYDPEAKDMAITKEDYTDAKLFLDFWAVYDKFCRDTKSKEATMTDAFWDKRDTEADKPLPTKESQYDYREQRWQEYEAEQVKMKAAYSEHLRRLETLPKEPEIPVDLETEEPSGIPGLDALREKNKKEYGKPPLNRNLNRNKEEMLIIEEGFKKFEERLRTDTPEIPGKDIPAAKNIPGKEPELQKENENPGKEPEQEIVMAEVETNFLIKFLRWFWYKASIFWWFLVAFIVSTFCDPEASFLDKNVYIGFVVGMFIVFGIPFLFLVIGGLFYGIWKEPNIKKATDALELTNKVKGASGKLPKGKTKNDYYKAQAVLQNYNRQNKKSKR